MNISSVTVKGQVTIPAAIRQQFSLDHGGEVIFSVDGDQIVIKPVHRSVEDAFGLVKSSKTVNLEQMEETIRLRGIND